MREHFGPETVILTESSISDIEKMNERVALMIGHYREKTISYIDGGGGRYGKLVPPWESID
jgi:PHP family Zn ribbon phosphoesterase